MLKDKEQIYTDINKLVRTGKVDETRLRRYIDKMTSKKKDAYLMVRFTEQEKTKIFSLAKKRKLTASELIRSSIENELNAGVNNANV